MLIVCAVRFTIDIRRVTWIISPISKQIKYHSSSQTSKKNLHFSVRNPTDNIEYILLVRFRRTSILEYFLKYVTVSAIRGLIWREYIKINQNEFLKKLRNMKSLDR